MLIETFIFICYSIYSISMNFLLLYDKWDVFNWIFVSVIGGCILAFILNVIFLIASKSLCFQLFLFFFNLISVISIECMHFYKIKIAINDVFMESPIIFLLVIVISTLIFGTVPQILIWIICFAILIVISAICDCVLSKEGYCGITTTGFLTTTFYYILLFLSFATLSIIVFYLTREKESNNKLIDSIKLSIEISDFDSKNVSELSNKDEGLCTKLEVLCKSIIQIAKINSNFIPINVRQAKKRIKQEEEEEQGESSDSSSSDSNHKVTSGLLELKKLDIIILMKITLIDFDVSNIDKMIFIVDTISQALNRYSGTFLQFINDEVFCIFEGRKNSKIKRDFYSNILKCALLILEKFETTILISLTKSSNCYSGVLFGKLNSINYVYDQNVKVSQNINETIKRDILKNKIRTSFIVCDGDIQNETKFEFGFKQIKYIQIESVYYKIFKLTQKNKTNENEEWMYQINQSQISNSDDKYEEAWNQFENGSIDQAIKTIEEHITKNPDDKEAKDSLLYFSESKHIV